MQKRLSDRVADDILTMIVIEKRFLPGEKLPQLSKEKSKAVSDTIQDHRTIMEFLWMRNGEGARSAMKIHILHAMEELNM